MYSKLLAREIDHAPSYASSSNHILLSLNSAPHSVLCHLAILLLFWLGSATDHRSHTPITTLFQYLVDSSRSQHFAIQVKILCSEFVQLFVQTAKDLLVSTSIGCFEGGKQTFRQNYTTELCSPRWIFLFRVCWYEPDYSKQDATPQDGC